MIVREAAVARATVRAAASPREGCRSAREPNSTVVEVPQVEAGGECSPQSRPPLGAASACTNCKQFAFYCGVNQLTGRAAPDLRHFPSKLSRGARGTCGLTVSDENAFQARVDARATRVAEATRRSEATHGRRPEDRPCYFRSPLASARRNAFCRCF